MPKENHKALSLNKKVNPSDLKIEGCLLTLLRSMLSRWESFVLLS